MKIKLGNILFEKGRLTMGNLTPRQALQKIKSLKFTFHGDRYELHEKIDRIISRVR